MKKRTLKRLWGGALAGAIAVGGGGGALALGATPAGASNAQVSIAGSFTTFYMMHALFPTTINDLYPGGIGTIVATSTFCTGGVTYTTGSPAPNGSTQGKTALHAEETARTTTATPTHPTDPTKAIVHTDKGCIDFSRSSSPPKFSAGTVPFTTSHTSTTFDYYAYALDGVVPMVGSASGAKLTQATPTTTGNATLTVADLRNIYHCAITNWSTLGGATAPIIRFWPQSGSGTRDVYKDILGFTPAVTATKGACLTPAITHFTHVTIGGTHFTNVPNEENTESGIIYQASITPMATPISDAIYIYSSGKFTQQWNDTAHYKATGVNTVNGAAIGNFERTTTTTGNRLLLANMRNTTTGLSTTFVNYTTTTRTYSVNTGVVNQTNEWYSHMPASNSAATASAAHVAGIRYVYNVCDTKTAGYSECKAMVGFDNQPQPTTTGLVAPTPVPAQAKSALCDGQDAATILAQGFVPLPSTPISLNKMSTSDLANATCREFPGKSYPGYATPRSWTRARPVVLSVSPSTGSVAGGTPVTITGVNFLNTTVTPTVKFGTATATTVTVVAWTTITCKTPAHAAGTVDVTVTTTRGGTSATSSLDHFTY
ncbi:MAG TPA: IPT/TIG domain-containing protein [Acidimicrobiales bacterium]|nr:IPT/TIG domain-containing protein [Acidimicrobiales bacterium]